MECKTKTWLQDIHNNVFYLLACFESTCSHPFCKKNSTSSRSEYTWFPNGPPLHQLPVPKPDIERPYGGNCTECKGMYSGHYLKPQQSLASNSKCVEPPSSVIMKAFKAGNINLQELSREVMLPQEVKIWLDHLQTVADNRKRGAEKAAQTRQKKLAACKSHDRSNNQESDMYLCGVCGGVYREETEEVEKWIGCDKCDLVSLGVCTNIFRTFFVFRLYDF